MKKTIQKTLTALAVTAMLIPLTANATSPPRRIRLDVNNDKAINAIDASVVLAEYAATSTNQAATFGVTEKYLADANYDGAINAVDASEILSVYAYNATSDEPMFEQTVGYTAKIKYRTREDVQQYDNYEDCMKWIENKKAEFVEKWKTEPQDLEFYYEIWRCHQTTKINSGNNQVYVESGSGEIMCSP